VDGALNNLGISYKRGEGVRQDFRKAIEFFERAAEKGNMGALFNLALCYERGEGVERDVRRAHTPHAHARTLARTGARAGGHGDDAVPQGGAGRQLGRHVQPRSACPRIPIDPVLP
jgi:TPR repeat protein